MDKFRIAHFIVSLALLAAALLAVTAPAEADSGWGPHRTPSGTRPIDQAKSSVYVEWIYRKTGEDNGKEWIDNQGYLHIRDRMDSGFLKGDIYGDAVLSYNAWIDHQTGDGNAWGTIAVSDFANKRLAPALWVGTWRQTLREWKVTGGTLQADGAGPNLGLRLRGLKCTERPDSMLAYGGTITIGGSAEAAAESSVP